MPKEKRTLLEDFLGRSSLTLRVDGKEALDISVRKREIIVDIKSPVDIMELGMKGLTEKKSGMLVFLKALKLMNYKVILRYKKLELEL